MADSGVVGVEGVGGGGLEVSVDQEAEDGHREEDDQLGPEGEQGLVHLAGRGRHLRHQVVGAPRRAGPGTVPGGRRGDSYIFEIT